MSTCNETENKISVRIRLSAEKNETVSISSNSSVTEIKTVLSERTGRIPDSFSVVFSGKVLTDETELKALGLSSHSILHVINKNLYEAEGPKSTNQQTGVSQYQFYVYCKTCESLEPGKLRVRCVTCQDGGVVLDQEPNNWEDVLTSDRLTCVCTNCDNQQFAQFYFKCRSHDAEDSVGPLRYIRPNSRHIECIICMTERSPILVNPCRDRHVICVDCFKTYAQVSLDSRTFVRDEEIGYTLSCPAGCENSYIKDIHHFQLLGRTQYERYKDFGAEECLLESGGVLCPQPGCGEGMIIDESAESVTCKTCYYEFCRRCKQEVHHGDCNQTNGAEGLGEYANIEAERALRARWDSQSLDTISKVTKPCPQCATRTERNGGCMHMKCTRCREDWCWLCEKLWTRTCQGDHWFG